MSRDTSHRIWRGTSSITTGADFFSCFVVSGTSFALRPLVSPKFVRVPQEGGRVQGWESVCCGVLGIPLLENRKVCRIHQIPISCFLIDLKFISKILERFLNQSSLFTILIFTFLISKWCIQKLRQQTNNTNLVHAISNNFKILDYHIFRNNMFENDTGIFLNFV